MLLQLCSNCKFHLVIQDHKRSDLCLSKRDNVSRCIDLHQVLYIYVKMSIHVSRFTYTYQDPLASTSSLIHIDQIPSFYTDRQSNTISKFEYRHQDPHIYIKITRSRFNDLLPVTECVMVSFSLESKLSNRFALRTLTFELNSATSHY